MNADILENNLPDTFIYSQVMVVTPSASYPIEIGLNILSLIESKFKGYSKIALLTNQTLFRLYPEIILTWEKHYPNFFYLEIADGEKYKDITTLNEVYQHLIRNNFNRDGLIVVLGGGVVGDLGGFAAASYMRGVDFVQIPTTLLAMVDSSIGGKTAINLAHNKNIMGAFHQPRLVCCDLNFLQTLPEREFMAGMMEIIKYGLILDEEFYLYISQYRQAILNKDHQIIAYLVDRSCRFKAHIISMDETDQGIRNILNLGHTIGHALESYTDYQYYLHGEAIAIGTAAIMYYLHEQGIFSDETLHHFIDLLDAFSLPHTIPQSFDTETLCNQLRYDKKNKNNRIQWVLLKKIGVAAWEQHINLNQIEIILQRIKK